MLANKSGSYYEEYRRSKSRARPGLEDERLLTDRAAYQSFLEVQLERVSAACLTSQGFSDRIEEVQASVLTFDEKINNLARAVKVTETKGQRQVDDAASAVNDVTRKLGEVQDDVMRVDNKLETTHKGLTSLRLETESFEQRQKDLTEVLRRRLEEKILDMSSRLELEEARGKTNETRIVSLGDMAREETKTAAETLQSKLDLRMEALREQLDLRVSSLEARVANGLEHFKAFEAADGNAYHFALENAQASANIDADAEAEDDDEAGANRGPAAGGRRRRRGSGIAKSSSVLRAPLTGSAAPGALAALRSEVERVRQEAASHTDATAKRVLAALETLEAKVLEGAGAPSSSVQTVTRLVRRIDEMELRMETVEQENARLRDQVGSLRQELRRASPRSGGSGSDLLEDRAGIAAIAVVDSDQEEAAGDANDGQGPSRAEMREQIQKAVSKVSKDLRSVLGAVERKLVAQSELVAESMSKVEIFMDVFDTAQATIEERVRAGRLQEKRLQAMLQASAEAMQAEEEADLRLGAESKAGSFPYQIAMDFYEHPAIVRRARTARSGGPRKMAVSKAKKATSSLKKPAAKGRSLGPAAAVRRSRTRTLSAGSDSEVVGAGHTVPTASSLRRLRSKTPPPFVVSSEREAERLQARRTSTDDEMSGSFTDSSGPRQRDGGGKRGREQLARVSSSEMLDTLGPRRAPGADPDDVANAQEPLRATDGRRDARASQLAAAAHRPAWGAPPPSSR